MTEVRLVTLRDVRQALDATGRVIVLRTSRLEVNDGIAEVFAALPAAAPASDSSALRPLMGAAPTGATWAEEAEGSLPGRSRPSGPQAAAPAEGLREALEAFCREVRRDNRLRAWLGLQAAYELGIAALARHESGSE